MDCPLTTCSEVLRSTELFLEHIRTVHGRYSGGQYSKARFTCNICSNKQSMLYKNYMAHMRKKHKNFSLSDTGNFNETSDNGDTDNTPTGSDSTESVHHQNADMDMDIDFGNAGASDGDNDLDAVIRKCEEVYLKLAADPSITFKSAGEQVEQLKEISIETILSVTSGEESARLTSLLNRKFKHLSSEYFRQQWLNNHPLYVPSVLRVIDTRLEVVASNAGRIGTQYAHNNMAKVSILKTVQNILGASGVADKLVWPSSCRNREILDHPLCGQRTADLYEKIGGDFVAVQLYFDDYNVKNHLGSTGNEYKTIGCYMKILNMPVEWLSDAKCIFEVFLAHSADLKDDRQTKLQDAIVAELQDLEEPCVEVTMNGQTERLPIVLHSISADNLGYHECHALKNGFRGPCCCRMCKVPFADLTKVSEVVPELLRSKAEYDERVATGDISDMESFGIASACSLNSLRYYHLYDAFNVDFMHDVLEGHFLYKNYWLLNKLIAPGSSISLAAINNAILDFPYMGIHKENKPIPIMPDHLKSKGKYITRFTASMSLNFMALFPLIMHYSNIVPTNPEWQLVLQFQHILDMLMAFRIRSSDLPVLQQRIKEYFEEYVRQGGHSKIALLTALL